MVVHHNNHSQHQMLEVAAEPVDAILPMREQPLSVPEAFNLRITISRLQTTPSLIPTPHAIRRKASMDMYKVFEGCLDMGKRCPVLPPWITQTGASAAHTIAIPGFSRTPADPIDTEIYPESALCMRRNDVAFHLINSVHYSGTNESPSNRRQIGIPCYSSRAKRDEKAFKEYQQNLDAFHKTLENTDR